MNSNYILVHNEIDFCQKDFWNHIANILEKYYFFINTCKYASETYIMNIYNLMY